ncbi:MAG: hypothetical protein ACRD32_01595 [Nitrososphaerales archaeon]
MSSLDKCCICDKDTLLGIDVKGKKICIECSNKIFIKYQSFVEKPKAIDLSNLDKIKGLAEEKKELQSLYVHFRDVLHLYDKLDDLAHTAKIPTELMERLYILGQRIRITNILLTDMRSALENNDIAHIKTNKKKVNDEISICKKELSVCENEIKTFVKI